MWFNNKRKTKQGPDDFSATDRIARKLVDKILIMQTKWAGLMQRIWGTLSRPAQKICLFGFVSFSIAFSLYLIIGSLHQARTSVMQTGLIRIPAYVTKPPGLEQQGSELVAEETYRQLLRFRLRMDSLEKSSNGKLIADSIRRMRPGLLDSVAALGRIYQMQQLKK